MVQGKGKILLKSQPVWLGLVFLVLSLLVYYPALSTYFVSDDWHWLLIARDTHISGQIFLTNYEGNNFGGSYNPLLVLFFKLFFKFFGTHYVGYHLVSILLQAINTFLVFLLARIVLALAKVSSSDKWATVAAVSFLVWPIHVETVYWISAWPHLWTTLFYLLSLLSYFHWRQSSKVKFFLLSLIFFSLALLTKEVAISLPFIILVWEAYFYSIHKFTEKNIIRKFLFSFYFLLLGIFMFIRYVAIGLLFGYYGQHDLQVSFTAWIGNLASFFNEFVSASLLRVIFFKGYYHYLDSVVIITLVALALYFYYLLKKKQYFVFTVFISTLLALAPMLVVGLHHTTFAGDRYMYLPLSFFVLWVILILAQAKWSYKVKAGLFIVWLLFSLAVIEQKSYWWREGSSLGKQIVASYQDLKINPGQILVSIGLPDNLSGAEVFRNNLGQALIFTYPDIAPEVLPLPVYVHVNPKNKDSHLLNWRRDELGWFAESADKSYVVTGMTSITVNDFYFELWGYNYQNYTASIIRLMPKGEMIDKLKTGQVRILTFDQGRLKILE